MKIAIIGAGWLGLPLAQSLKQSGHAIVATKRTTMGVESLQSLGVTAVQFSLGDCLTSPELVPIFDANILIINIPPGRKSPSLEQFSDNMKSLVTTAKKRGVQHIIFISTTAVYGESDNTVYEYSSVNPQTASAKAHVEIENHIRELYNNNGCILRLAGLVSQDRHPAKSLSGRKNIENGQRSVNLVHRDDVIAAIKNIIEKNKFGHTYHLCSLIHPTRQQYYSDAALALGLPPPEFSPLTATSVGKRIDCKLTLAALKLTLKYPSPYDML